MIFLNENDHAITLSLSDVTGIIDPDPVNPGCIILMLRKDLPNGYNSVSIQDPDEDIQDIWGAYLDSKSRKETE